MNNLHSIARALVVIGALGFSAPALADTMCLRKAPDAQVKPPASGKAPGFNAVVLAQDAAAYLAKGFTVVDCPSIVSQAQYREAICAAAEHGNSSVQDQLERQIGEKPAKVCAAARAAVTLPMKLPAISRTEQAPPPNSDSPKD